MKFWKKLFRRDKPLETVRFLRDEKSPGGAYEIYESNDAESAKKFLHTKKVEKDKHYIVVETPEGAWGLDKLGLYLERLLPFQFDIDSSDYEGYANIPMDNIAGLDMAANGINESFVTSIECGKCQNKWLDAVRFQNVTAVKCPKCKTVNRIDTEHIHYVSATEHKYKLFELFLEGLTEEGYATAKSAMSSINLKHELLAIYPNYDSFENSMNLANKLPYHFHPICMRLEDGGVIYIRCHFTSSSELNNIYQKFEKGSRKIYTVPEVGDVAIH